MKKLLIIITTFITIVGLFTSSNILASPSKVDEIFASMSNEEKIAQMLMPAFRKPENGSINNDNVKDVISAYNFAGVILFSENTQNIESTMRFVDMLQSANKDHATRLLIATDQEGGYVTRLAIGTSMPGNMALTATNNPIYAYNAAKVIGRELKTLGINTNFAPVVDVNNNPSNPVIGVRSFSDDASTVANYANKFMEGLHSEGVMTSLKHFPGHGDTSNDSHTGLVIVDKTYDELKNNELIPFQKLINNGTDMIMTAHIQYPKIETETYVSKKDGKTYTLPATLSKKILTDILRNDMGYDGIIVTDALDMKAIAEQFGLIDASIKAINAGADILLMPYIYDTDKEELKTYIQTLANKIGTEISEENVNASVKRILKLKEKNGLLEEYDNSNLEQNIENAKKIVSSKENHDLEFEIAKKAITMVKNDDDVLPIDTKDKTVIFYAFTSHIEAINNAIDKLIKDGSNINKDNIVLYPIYENNIIDLDKLKKQVKDAKNIIVINSMYGLSDLTDPDLAKLNELMDYAHKQNVKTIFMSTHLPYDAAIFKSADAIVITYLANGIKFKLDNLEYEIPKYGANVMAGIYMMFSEQDNMNGVLPVNIYDVDNNDFTHNVLFERGLGLKYNKIKSVEVESNVGNASISNTTEELNYIINLTNEEKSTIENGKVLYVILEVNDISKTVSDADKELVESKLDKNSKIGMYLDINLFKQLDVENKIKIEQTNKKIKISFEIPENLRKSNREFYIIRLHDGVTTKIYPTIKDNILTFETDKFSTYALVYNDIKNPNTIDDILKYFAMLGLSIIIFIVRVINKFLTRI